MIIQKTIGFFINIIGLVSPKLAGKAALFLFTKPFKGKITEKQSDFLDTAFREELSYDGFPVMTYRWLSQGKKTILLAHGWQSNSARWKSLIPSLIEKGYHVVALDAPAHGNSGSKRFNAMLYAEFINVAATRFKPEIIVAHSVGGMASIYCMHKYENDAIKKIILLGAPSEFIDILKRYTDMMSYGNRTIRGLELVIEDKFGIKTEEFSTVKHLKSILSDGLIIHDKKDQIIPYADAVLINTHFKNSKLIATEGFGHSLYGEDVSSHIYEFIENE